MTSVPAVVLGATGYVGGELLRLIATHPLFDLVAAVSESRAGKRIPRSRTCALHSTIPCLQHTMRGSTGSRQARRWPCFPPPRTARRRR